MIVSFVQSPSNNMDYEEEVLESFTTGCGDFLGDIASPLFGDNLKTSISDVFLNSSLPDDDYNILNLDSFVSKADPTTGDQEDDFDSSQFVDPKVFLLDINGDRFEELLQSEISEQTTGNLLQISKTDGTVNIAGVPLKFECTNCERLFNYENHLQHVCEFDDNGERIVQEDYDAFEGNKTTQLLRDNQSLLRLAAIDTVDDEKNERKCVKSHVCKICLRSYVHGTGLARHMKTHTEQTLVKLPKRAAASVATTTTVKHIEDVTVVCQCLFCGRIFNSAMGALDHYRTVHLSGDTKHVPETETDDKENSGLAEPSNKPKEAAADKEDAVCDVSDQCDNDGQVKPAVIESKLRCEFCDFEFLDAAQLLQHAASHNPADGYECAYCDILSMIAKTMTNHWTTECPFELHEKRLHINVKVLYSCNVCESKFPSLNDLYDHRYSAYHFFPRWNVLLGALQIGCEKCGSLFTKVAELTKHHEETHSTAPKKTTDTCRPYLCEVCGKGYTQSSHLYQHLRFHQGVKPFGCPKEDCTRRFTIRPDLNDHIRKCHTGERPYHCKECDKKFLTGSVFYQHRLIHRGERRYKCNSCGKRFHRSDALKNHERIHTGDKPFPCTICTKTFRQKGDRDKHLRSRHRNQDANGNETATINPNFYKNIMNVVPSFKNVNGIDILSMVNSA